VFRLLYLFLSPFICTQVTMAPLKVVALISGGKDSLFSILHCIANGNDVVALANLHPAMSAPEDIDSYMYQTIGHAVIPLYEEALGLPLYRQEITGGAVNQDKSYGPDHGSEAPEDEAESLVPLLRKVMAAHPEVNAVSTGAILSDYQRTRVESVAIRLGLTPLSYLWQWPSLPPQLETSLLEDMDAVGQDSRIIKVASGALDDSFLWQNVADRRTRMRLTKAAQRFGALGDGAALGEGGEYETLAVSGPSPVWKKDIVVDETERDVVPGEAGSFSISVRTPRLAEKTEMTNNLSALRTPTLLDSQFENILQRLQDETSSASLKSIPTGEDGAVASIRSLHSDDDVLLTGLTGDGSDAAAQMTSIMDSLVQKLTELNHQMTDIAYTTIVMRDMTDFPSINAVYGKYFISPNPPARVTIASASALPSNALLSVDVTSIKKQPHGSRKGLHVQSRSYWAPANIGPYSQAITVPTRDETSIIYIAGQIPLVPASMELVEPSADKSCSDFQLQAVLSLQHLSRIGNAMNVRQWAAVIAFVVVGPSDNSAHLATTLRQVWSLLFTQNSGEGDEQSDEEADDFDVWHAKQSHFPRTEQAPSRSALTKRGVPPIYIAQVDALPRGASIEWVGYGMTRDAESPIIPHMQHLLHVFSAALL
jgi:diphthine-ammonia ligase